MVEKSDKFDECMLNRQNFSYQNFSLRKFRYCIFTNLSLSGFVMLCQDMESGILLSDYPCKKDNPEDKDLPKGRSYPIYLGHV